MRMVLSVDCPTPGRLSIGPPLIVGCPILPEPVRTAITRSDSAPSMTGRNRPRGAIEDPWRAALHRAQRAAAKAPGDAQRDPRHWLPGDRKSTRLNSSHLGISYAVFCLKKKNTL